MKVLVTGSRDWTDPDRIRRRLSLLPWVYPDMPTIIHGAASRKVRGVEQSADMLADAIARALGFRIERFPADWQPGPETRSVKRRADGTLYDPQAGHRRNLLMLAQAPDLVLAFQRNGSRGTQHTIDEARKRGIPVEVYAA